MTVRVGGRLTQGAGWGEADPGIAFDSATAGHAAALHRLLWMENVLEQATDTDARTYAEVDDDGLCGYQQLGFAARCEYAQTIQSGLAQRTNRGAATRLAQFAYSVF